MHGSSAEREYFIVETLKRCAAAASAAAIVMSAAAPVYCHAEENSVNTKEIIIDGTTENTNEVMLYRGAGMVSANNSSRLLLDYKAENPEAYHEILEYMFGDEGIGINHLKVEMGADINSSSGTEPGVKRSEDEKADVTRGAGYQLAADAKAVNPDLTIDMLWWSEPHRSNPNSIKGSDFFVFYPGKAVFGVIVSR